MFPASEGGGGGVGVFLKVFLCPKNTKPYFEGGVDVFLKQHSCRQTYGGISQQISEKQPPNPSSPCVTSSSFL